MASGYHVNKTERVMVQRVSHGWHWKREEGWFYGRDRRGGLGLRARGSLAFTDDSDDLPPATEDGFNSCPCYACLYTLGNLSDDRWQTEWELRVFGTCAVYCSVHSRSA